MAGDGPTYGFAPGHIAGGYLFVSGQLGLYATGDVPEDPATQGRLALEALGEVLAEAGCTFADVTSLHTFHVGSIAEANIWFLPAKAALFGPPYPAWTAVGVTNLAVDGAIIEISAIAELPD
ncbi:Rid family hydrolase [Nocardia jiangxiensis]|uniref:Rid family hydrolase n=1 Tax=Nocardia jiangxiensis TaxID=282685 RepID=A0ABW6SCQ3_9NOCA|nr:Rid family hydrolase [Nocardia jiangxiensis]